MKKRIIFLIITFLFVFFILKNLNNGEKLLGLLLIAKWQFVLVAFFLQSIHYLILSVLHKKALGLFNIKWKLKEIIPLVLAALSINVFTILAPFPGSGMFIQRARKDEKPALNVTASIFSVVLFDYLALCPLILVSLFFLGLNHKIFNYEILGATIFILLTLLLVFFLLFGIISPKLLNSIFSLIEKAINKIHNIFKKRGFFMKGWSQSRAIQFIELSKKLINNKGQQFKLFEIALLNHFIDLLTLFMLFLAFGQMIPTPTLLVGYSLMLVFWIITPTPQGVGVVEVITPAIFSSMGVPVETATLAVLAFRGLNLWLPVIVGYYFLNKLIQENN